MKTPDSKLSDAMLERLADRFKALAEPTRLCILQELRNGEQTVSELMEATGLQQANLSKHLQVLRTMNFVERRKEGLFVYYRIADSDVFALCDLVCDRIEREAVAAHRVATGRDA
jgi:DNA-binding transcriptional ArsR family regulator